MYSMDTIERLLAETVMSLRLLNISGRQSLHRGFLADLIFEDPISNSQFRPLKKS